MYRNREDELFHPYYDEFDDEIWLKSNVLLSNEVLFEFYVQKPENWTRISTSRLAQWAAIK